jgi:hypothetical protein
VTIQPDAVNKSASHPILFVMPAQPPAIQLHT